MPSNILNLPAYEVFRVDSDDHNYHIGAVVVVQPTVCKACSSDFIVGFGRRELLIKGIPSHGKRVGTTQACHGHATDCEREGGKERGESASTMSIPDEVAAIRLRQSNPQ